MLKLISAWTVQHIEMPFAPYDRAMLDTRSLSAVAELLVKPVTVELKVKRVLLELQN